MAELSKLQLDFLLGKRNRPTDPDPVEQILAMTQSRLPRLPPNEPSQIHEKHTPSPEDFAKRATEAFIPAQPRNAPPVIAASTVDEEDVETARPEPVEKPAPADLGDNSFAQRLRTLKKRLALQEGITGIGEGLSKFGDITTQGEVLLGLGPKERDHRNLDARARNAVLREKVEELETQEGDPNSQISKFLRQNMGEFGMPLPAGISANQIKKFFPAVYKPLAERYEADADAAAKQAKGEAGAKDATGKLLNAERSRFLNATRDSRQIIQEAENIEGLINSGPLGFRPAINKILRLSGEVGALSNRDVASVANRLGLEGGVDRVYEFLFSDKSGGYKRQLIKLAKDMARDAKKAFDENSRKEAKSFLEINAEDLGMDPEADVESVLERVYGVNPGIVPHGKEGTVLFRSKEDGKLYRISRSKGQEAQEAGEGEIIGGI